MFINLCWSIYILNPQTLDNLFVIYIKVDSSIIEIIQ